MRLAELLKRGWLPLSILLLLAEPVLSADANQVDRDQFEVMVRRATDFLLGKGRTQEGAYSPSSGPALTALATTALLQHGLVPDAPRVAESLRYLEGFVQPDGGIYQPGTFYKNYETSVAVFCFQEANRDSRYDEVLAAANRFLTGLQWDESEELSRSESAYGGAGYGRHRRPDLSNTSFLVEVLIASGDDADSEAIQRALVFVSRCQNFESEQNTTPFAEKNPDGGFYYTAAAGGESQAGTTENGGLRSYGSMTYAGLKSMIYAGLDQSDPRVRAAYDWLQEHYRLDTNPGMGSAGLYYYYHTLAKALSVMKVDQIKDADGKSHHWRSELVRELASRQQPDGSWVNENERWLEGDPNLVTAYALLALAYCSPQ